MALLGELNGLGGPAPRSMVLIEHPALGQPPKTGPRAAKRAQKPAVAAQAARARLVGPGAPLGHGFMGWGQSAPTWGAHRPACAPWMSMNRSPPSMALHAPCQGALCLWFLPPPSTLVWHKPPQVHGGCPLLMVSYCGVSMGVGGWWFNGGSK